MVYTTTISQLTTPIILPDLTEFNIITGDDGIVELNVNPFVFNGKSYTTLYLNYNGAIQFSNEPLIPYNVVEIPHVAGIYPFFIDLNTVSPNYIAYKVLEDEVVVFFNTSIMFQDDTHITIKIVLYLKSHVESGKIKIDYGDMNLSDSESRFCTGISFGFSNTTSELTEENIFAGNYTLQNNVPIFNSYQYNTLINNRTLEIIPLIQIAYTTTISRLTTPIILPDLTEFTIITGDEGIVELNVPPFIFNGTPYTTLYLNYDGAIQFSNETLNPYRFNEIPHVAGIYPFFIDLDTVSPNYIAYKVLEDEVVVFFNTSIFAQPDTHITIKIVLYLKSHVESGKIKIDYGDMNLSDSESRFCTGISFGSSNTTSELTEENIFAGNYKVQNNVPIFNSYQYNTFINNRTLEIIPSNESVQEIQLYDKQSYTSILTIRDTALSFSELTGYTEIKNEMHEVVLSNPFIMNDLSYTSLFIHSNGSIQFSDTTVDTTLSSVPSVAGIYPFYATLNTTNYNAYKVMDDELSVIFNTSLDGLETSVIQIRVSLKLNNHPNSGMIIVEYGDMDLSTSEEPFYSGISFGEKNKNFFFLQNDLFMSNHNGSIFSTIFPEENIPLFRPYSYSSSIRNKTLTFSPKPQSIKMNTRSSYSSVVVNSTLPIIFPTSLEDYVVLTGDDDMFPIQLSYSNPFIFNDSLYTTLYLNLNGSIQFENTYVFPYDIRKIPSVPGIYPFYMDLLSLTPNYVAYKVLDTQLIVFFNTSLYYDDTGTIQFKVTMNLQNHPESGKVVVEYGTMNLSEVRTDFYAGISFGKENTNYELTSHQLFLNDFKGQIFDTDSLFKNIPFFNSYSSNSQISNKTLTIYPKVNLQTINAYSSILSSGEILPTDLSEYTVVSGYYGSTVKLSLSESNPFIFNQCAYANLYLTYNGSIQFYPIDIYEYDIRNIPINPGIYPCYFHKDNVDENYLYYKVLQNEVVIIFKSKENVHIRVSLKLKNHPESGKIRMEYEKVDLSASQHDFYAGISFGKDNITRQFTNEDLFLENYTLYPNQPMFKSYAYDRSIRLKTVDFIPSYDTPKTIYNRSTYSTKVQSIEWVLPDLEEYTLLTGDDGTEELILPDSNPFIFNHRSYTYLYLNYDGAIQFADNAYSTYDVDSVHPIAGIYPFYVDIITEDPNYIAYKIEDDQLKIIYHSSLYTEDTSEFMFKITLYLKNHTDSGKVVVEYGNMDFSTSDIDFYAGISFGNNNTTYELSYHDLFMNDYLESTFTAIDYYGNVPMFKSYPSTTSIQNKSITFTPHQEITVPNINTLLTDLVIPQSGKTIKVQIYNPISSRPGSFYYSSSNESVATVEENLDGCLMTITGVGQTDITVIQPKKDRYLEESKIVSFDSSTFQFITDICFPSGTQILTDQGTFPIEQLTDQTIDGKHIVYITKTKTFEKYLVCFEKDSIETNIPSKMTRMTLNHKLMVRNEIRRACDLVNGETIHLEDYQGETLYNVLMDEHYQMNVHHLICETLNPTSQIAMFYHN